MHWLFFFLNQDVSSKLGLIWKLVSLTVLQATRSLGSQGLGWPQYQMLLLAYAAADNKLRSVG